MKKPTNAIFFLLIILLAIGCTDSKTKSNSNDDVVKDEAGGTYTGPPYTIQLEEFVNEQLPDLHSYTHATYKDKIIMIGGRTNGLHGGTYNFNRANSNKNIYVLDTKNWADPTQWKVYNLPANKVSVAGVNTDQLMANNAEFFTEDSVLYIVGGMLGGTVATQLKVPNDPSKGLMLVPGLKAADGSAPIGPKTLPYITAINLPDLINSVVNKKAMPSGSIRQVKNDSLAITGGELSIMDSTIYLVFGWNFYFSTPQDLYSHQIRTFSYTDDGKNLTISPITVCSSCWDKEPDSSTAGNFRRRDGSISAMIDPADGSQGLVYYAGVFKGGNTNFDSPVWIGKNDAAEQPFVIRSNVYTCMVVPAYSASRKESYATLLGGMKNASYNGAAIKLPVELTATNAPIIPTHSKNPFDHIPFSNQFSTVVVNAKHAYSQYLLPDSFPTTKRMLMLPASAKDSIAAMPLPIGSVTYNGSEAELMWTLDPAMMMKNGVVDYDNFIKKNPSGGSVGYLHGGIQSYLTNVFGAKAAHYSLASNRIFAVKIVPISK